MKAIKILALAITLNTINSNAQETESQPNTIENQFEALYKNSNNYQVYKVIKKNEFLALQKSALDSFKNLKNDIDTKEKQIGQHLTTIKELQGKIKNLNTDLSSSIAKEDSISLLGLQLKKGTYNTILWSVIIGLFSALAFFIYKFNNSNVVTKETKNLLTETEEELETYKKKAIEREQKLRRQLQDEINKQRGV